jgi:hypothetical protein
MKTCSITPADIKKAWLTVDCKDRPLGRVATEIASLLRGKHKRLAISVATRPSGLSLQSTVSHAFFISAGVILQVFIN